MPLIYALVITIVIEGITMAVITRSIDWVKYNLYCNMVTNPLLNMGLWLLVRVWGTDCYNVVCAIGEIIVLFTEMIFYRLMSDEKYVKCFIRSLITNALSLGLGYVIFTLL